MKESGNDVLAAADGGCMQHEVFSDVVRHLASVKEGLLAVSSNSEPDFMGVGARLQTGYELVTGLAREAVGVADLIGQDSGEGSLRSIGESVNRSLALLKKCRDNATAQSGPVKEVLGHFERLDSRRGKIDSIARYLRAVSLNIFIETSRSDISDENFTVLALEIKKLSEDIIHISKNIHNLTISSKRRFQSMYTEITDGISEITGLVDLAEQSAGNSMEKTEKLMTYSFGLVEEARTMSRAISREVEKIVMGIQLHDSMRQRVEHIVSGLDEVEHLCTRGAFPPLHGGEHAGDATTAHALISLQRAQIDQVIAEVDEVYGQSRQALEGITHDISLLSRHLAGMGTQGGDRERCRLKSEDPFALLASDLSTVQALEGRGEGLENRLGEIYQKAFETASALSTFAADLHDVSRDSQNKALNTIIAASHLGREGRSLAALAKEMKSLSNQAEEVIDEAEEIIASVVATIQGVELEKLFERGAEEGQRSLDAILTMVLGLYEQIKARSVGLLDTSAELTAIITETKETLSFLPLVGNDLKAQVTLLDGVKALLAPGVDEKASARIYESFMVERYTMEKERTVHKACMAPGPGFSEVASSGGVELFDEDAFEGDGGEEGFGANIELF